MLCAQVLPPWSDDLMKSAWAPKPKSCCRVMMFRRFAGLLVIAGSMSAPVIFHRPPARRDSRLRRDSVPTAPEALILDRSTAATAGSGMNYQEEHDRRSHGRNNLGLIAYLPGEQSQQQQRVTAFVLTDAADRSGLATASGPGQGPSL